MIIVKNPIKMGKESKKITCFVILNFDIENPIGSVIVFPEKGKTVYVNYKLLSIEEIIRMGGDVFLNCKVIRAYT